jgi:uncharacterized protein
MGIHRRSFVSGAGAVIAAGALSKVIASASPARASAGFRGYGDLIPDPNGILDLPRGFQYRIFSREGDALSHGGIVPSNHDGMAAFSAGRAGLWLVRNHEVEAEDVAEEGKLPVAAIDGSTYDPDGQGGTTTLLVGWDRQLRSDRISLAGTVNNCAGGPTPWHTWLTCEETTDIFSKPHGYVFEVDPFRGGNPEPIVAMGRFAHEAVAIDRRGLAYLSEDDSGPFGCLYRFAPNRPLGGRGSLHAGGALTAAAIGGLTIDLSVVQEPGTKLPVVWLPVPNANPSADHASVREQANDAGGTPIQKAEGVWTGRDGSVWFVSSYGAGPDAEEEEDRSAAAHAGQIWRYDPSCETLELVALFPVGVPYDSPDNITASPHGFALACNDGDGDQYLVAIDDAGTVYPFALNVYNDVEFAGATFSPSGQTLFVNIQEPGMTLAIWGPWTSDR